jgi:Uncharacterized protein, possibly involved in aromatic compounds catabolism
MDDSVPLVTLDDVNAALLREFADVCGGATTIAAAAIEPGYATLILSVPGGAAGGTAITSPAVSALADLAGWSVVVAHLGTAVQIVSTHLSIDFLKKPGAGPLLGRARLLKLASRFAVAGCEIFAQDRSELVATASATYRVMRIGKEPVPRRPERDRKRLRGGRDRD